MQIKRNLRAISLWLSAGLLLSVFPQGALASEATNLSGVVIAGGITCPMLKMNSGETVSLMGVTAQNARVGQPLRASGTFVRYSTCQQAARTFRIEKILNPAKGLQ